jgi:uncharacterized protein (TIGR01777 family)
MLTVIITGGTGLVGTALSKALLAKGCTVIILTRKLDPAKQLPGITYALWDVERNYIDPKALAQANAIIHLAGANVAEKRWTKKRKQEIIDSRVKTGECIVYALQNNPHQVTTIASASGIGYYGPDPVIPNPRPFDEEDKPYTDYLATTCVQWEKALEPVKNMGIKLVTLRTGIVLAKEGGAIDKFKQPLRFGVATVLGSGKQMVSWIHIEDLVRLFIRALEHEPMEGVYNAVAPAPVSNKTLMLTLAQRIKGKYFTAFHVPVFLLKLVLGEMSIEVLKSATVSCIKLHAENFSFIYPGIEVAIDDCVKRG